MCFSEKWSLNLSILGILITIYRIYNKYPITSIVPITAFTIMEIVQYLQYKVIDQCDNKTNQNLTKFSWALEWGLPLMWNIVYYNITKSNKDVFKFSIVLCLIVFITGLMRVFNNSKNKSVTHELQVKGRNCTISGDVHLAWNNNAQTYYGLEPNWFVYMLLWFIPTLWITPLKTGVFTFLFNLLGVVLTYIILGRKFNDQSASTWCLMTVPGILLGEFISV